MDKNLVFISYFSEENLELGRLLCRKGDFSSFFLWENNNLYKSVHDFRSFLSGVNTDENGFILKETLQSDNFANEVIMAINNLPFEPDYIIAKGTLSQLWPISIIKESILVETKCAVILENLILPLEDFEKKCLDNFDLIISMGGFNVPQQYLHKTIDLFSENMWFKPSLYQYIPEYMELPTLDNNLICCNSSNFKEACEDDRIDNKKSNIVDVDEIEESELAISMMLCDRIVNNTNYPEFDLLIKKVGKSPIKFEDFIDGDISKCNYFPNGVMLEDFVQFVGNKILKNIAFIQGDRIKGLEIT